MRVGHGTRRIEVLPGERMGGYADRSQGVRDVLDPLEVHVVTFADHAHRFAIVVADLICVNADIVDRIRTAVADLRIDSCWVAATHTHASPEAGCVPGGSPTPAGVGARLLDAAVVSAKAAISAERDATLATTRAWLSDLAGRRNAGDASPSDIPVDAIVVAGDGAPTGVLTVSPVHPTVLPADNSDVSADLNGGIRRALSTGGRWVVAATGAGGDISTRYTRQGRSAAEIDRLAAVVAAGLGVDRPHRARPGTVTPPVTTSLRLPAKPRSEVDAAVVAAPPTSALADTRVREVFEQGQRIARDLAAREHRDSYEIEIQAVGLAGLVLVAIPGELFLELGERIRERTGENVVVLGYTNGYLGYLPTADTPPTYETLVSPVRAGSGEQVVDAAVLAIESIRRSEQRR